MIKTKQVTFAEVYVLFAQPLRSDASCDITPVYAAASPELIQAAILEAAQHPWQDKLFLHRFSEDSELAWFQWSDNLVKVNNGRSVGIHSRWISKVQLLDIMVGRGGVKWLGSLEHID